MDKQTMVKICKYCGTEIITDDDRITLCGDDCYNKYYTLYNKVYSRHKYRVNKDNPKGVKTCFNCGKHFKGIRGDYCSKECKSKSGEVMDRLIIQERYSSPICLDCGIVVESTRHKYCNICIENRKKTQWKRSKWKPRKLEKTRKYKNVKIVK